MKKNASPLSILWSISLIFLSLSGYAQSGLEGFNYQTIVRDNAGVPLVNKNINFRFSILDAGPNGVAQYVETKLMTTNATGLVNHIVGKGNPTVGLFANIPFQNANQFLKVEADMNGANSFQQIGAIALMSVPYAQFAAKGNVGPKGDQGPKGDTGATGIQGPQGPAGPGVVTLMGYSPTGATVIPSLAPATLTVPMLCRTSQPYIAGAGERAVINMAASVVPNSAVSGLLEVGLGIDQVAAGQPNSGTFVPYVNLANPIYSYESVNDGSATASIHLVLDLVEGQQYIFGTIFRSTALSQYNMSRSGCNCNIMIVKQ